MGWLLQEKSSIFSARQAALDFQILSLLLEELFPEAATRPKLIGPDPLHTPVIFESILKTDPEPLVYAADFARNCSELGVQLTGISHHEYDNHHGCNPRETEKS
eukprot:COSAG01_NODE_9366_length_2468_cov_1.918109_2_plen_104_part_00